MSRDVTQVSGQRADRAVLVGGAALVVLVCWIALIREHATSATHHAPVSGIATAFGMWMVMMLAMMLPPVMPWVLLYSRLSRGDAGQRRYAFTATFLGGYFTVWAAYCLAAALTQQALVRGAMLGMHDLRVSPVIGGWLLVAAGLFQWTPWKNACLRHCRNPLTFFLTHWRRGGVAAFHMGLSHGLFCLACCWALMTVAFALGVMNFLWMAVLTLFLCVEKIAPRGVLLSRLSGGVFVAWGLWFLLL